MKITRVETFLVHPEDRNLVFVKVHTDEGLTGIGEAYSVGPDDATARVVQYLGEWLAGQDPMNAEHLWALMYNGSRFPGGSLLNAAISGIDQALWDIKGKALGVPVYQLLGGKCRDRVRASLILTGSTPAALADEALALHARYGRTALKIGPYPPRSEQLAWPALVRAAAAAFAAVRLAVGDEVDIAFDAHAKLFEPSRAIELANALREYRPFFLEEPLRPEHVDALARVAAQVDVPIATGEQLYTKYQFRELLVKQAADIIQPDVCAAGGLLELKKIAGMAEAFFVPVAPHNPMGPVATAASVHLAASTPNLLVLECIPDDQPPRRELVKEPIRLAEGHFQLPTAPGLGIELDEEAFPRFPFRTWHRPFPIRTDGSVAFV